MWSWGRFSPRISVSPANSHSTDCFTHHHHLSSRAGTIGQTVADVPSGLSLTPPQENLLYIHIKKGILHNTVHKTTHGILQESPLHQISTKSLGLWNT
jgi:hypothetical protein